MISKVESYVRGYKDIGVDAKFGIEYLSKDAISYSLVEEPSFDNGKGIRVLKQYGNGMKIKEFRVQLQRVTNYEEMKQTNIDNSNFMKGFEKWVETTNEDGGLPEIPGIQKVEITTSGYIEAVAEDQTSAVYVVGLRIIYLEK